MKPLPKRYEYLHEEDGPRMLRCALELHGIVETPGPASNGIILNWSKEIGVPGYSDDNIPWCGLFVAVVAKRADWPFLPKGNPLWAKNWASWENAGEPELGNVLVFERAGGGGHVGIYVGDDDSAYHVLGGNQSNAVTITRIAKKRLIACRQPFWRIAKPENVRRIRLSATGPLSKNEA